MKPIKKKPKLGYLLTLILLVSSPLKGQEINEQVILINIDSVLACSFLNDFMLELEDSIMTVYEEKLRLGQEKFESDLNKYIQLIQSCCTSQEQELENQLKNQQQYLIKMEEKLLLLPAFIEKRYREYTWSIMRSNYEKKIRAVNSSGIILDSSNNPLIFTDQIKMIFLTGIIIEELSFEVVSELGLEELNNAISYRVEDLMKE